MRSFEAEMEEQSTTCICRERVPNRVRYKRRVRRVAEVPSSRVATKDMCLKNPGAFGRHLVTESVSERH